MFARNYICSTALMLTLVSGSAMADEAYAKQRSQSYVGLHGRPEDVLLWV